MGIFGLSTPFDADIEKATSETNTNENWSLILDVCDKVSSNPRNAKDCLKAIMKRMGHADPHVVMQAITLLDACANNCGKPFHLEIASREFENEFRRLLGKAQPKVSLKMRQVLKNWVENDFKTDHELNLIPTLYLKLRLDGYDFTNLNEKPAKSPAAKLAVSKDPNVVNSQQEEDDIAKAIELSLKESKSSPNHQTTTAAASVAPTSTTATAYPSLYPSFSGGTTTGAAAAAVESSSASAATNATAAQPEPRKVRALYDFEAAEENELTFFSGEIIHVLDDTDANWWKGFNQRGDGLFPSNFVTADLSVDPERLDINQQNNKSKKSVQFEDDARELQQKTEAAAAAAANERVEIDETKIDRLLHLLHEANPEDPSQDSDEMLRLEQEVHQMGPLIDAELERVDRKHAQLTQLSSDLVDAINLYHSLMRDDRAALMGAGVGASGGFMPGMPTTMMPGAMPSLGYQGAPNPQMLYGAAGYSGGAAGNFPQQMPTQNYGMPSMTFTNSGQLGATMAAALPTTAHNSSIPGAASNAGAAAGYNASMQMQIAANQMPIPMQYQNGHVNGGLNALPPHMSSPMAHGQQQQQPQQQHHHQQQMYGSPQQPTPQQQQQLHQSYQMLPTQQQQQFSQPTHNQTTAAVNPTATNNPQQQSTAPPASAPATQQQQQQFMSPHAGYMPQQQHSQQYAAAGQQQQAYMQAPPSTVGVAQAGMPPTMNNNNPDQYSQLQQQMAALSAMGINQPVTQNFLVQNEPKNNIPIYQQQR